jgi:hypothetical protein
MKNLKHLIRKRDHKIAKINIWNDLNIKNSHKINKIISIKFSIRLDLMWSRI